MYNTFVTQLGLGLRCTADAAAASTVRAGHNTGVKRATHVPNTEVKCAASRQNGVIDGAPAGAPAGWKDMLDWFKTRTDKHIQGVQKYCDKIEALDPQRFKGLRARGRVHDRSKYGEVEHDPYVHLTWRYRCRDRGDDYELPSGTQERVRRATEHHVRSNRHHPEYGCSDAEAINRKNRDKPGAKVIDATHMTDLDVAEMCADWCAVSEEKGNSPVQWADDNVGKRWRFTPRHKTLIYQLVSDVFPGETTAVNTPEKAASFAAMLGTKLGSIQSDLKRARRATDTKPSEAQIEAGNYKKGKLQVHGLTISIENPKGSTRSGTDSDGKAWRIRMASDYGYFGDGSKGADGEQVDCFIGPEPANDYVHVVDQVNPKTGKFDECKVMLGFQDKSAARKGYLANYDRGWRGCRAVTRMDIPEFKTWLARHSRKPAADTKSSMFLPQKTSSQGPAGCVATPHDCVPTPHNKSVGVQFGAKSSVLLSQKASAKEWQGVDFDSLLCDNNGYETELRSMQRRVRDSAGVAKTKQAALLLQKMLRHGSDKVSSEALPNMRRVISSEGERQEICDLSKTEVPFGQKAGKEQWQLERWSNERAKASNERSSVCQLEEGGLYSGQLLLSSRRMPEKRRLARGPSYKNMGEVSKAAVCSLQRADALSKTSSSKAYEGHTGDSLVGGTVSKQSAMAKTDTLSIPENWDRDNKVGCKKYPSWEAWTGGNDWEVGWTYNAVYDTSGHVVEPRKVVWYRTKFPKDMQSDGSIKQDDEARDWAKAGYRKWVRAIEAGLKKYKTWQDGGYEGVGPTHNIIHLGLEILKSEDMKPYVDKYGVDFFDAKPCGEETEKRIRGEQESAEECSKSGAVQPDEAPAGKCWAVKWADGRAIQCFRHRNHAQSWYDSGKGHYWFEAVDDGPKLIEAKKSWRIQKKLGKPFACDEKACEHPSHTGRKTKSSSVPAAYRLGRVCSLIRKYGADTTAEQLHANAPDFTEHAGVTPDVRQYLSNKYLRGVVPDASDTDFSDSNWRRMMQDVIQGRTGVASARPVAPATPVGSAPAAPAVPTAPTVASAGPATPNTDIARVIFAESPPAGMQTVYDVGRNRLALTGRERSAFGLNSAQTLRDVYYQPRQFSAINDANNSMWGMTSGFGTTPEAMASIAAEHGSAVADRWREALRYSTGTPAVVNPDILAYHDQSITNNPFSNAGWTYTPQAPVPLGTNRHFIPYTVAPATPMTKQQAIGPSGKAFMLGSAMMGSVGLQNWLARRLRQQTPVRRPPVGAEPTWPTLALPGSNTIQVVQPGRVQAFLASTGQTVAPEVQQRMQRHGLVAYDPKYLQQALLGSQQGAYAPATGLTPSPSTRTAMAMSSLSALPGMAVGATTGSPVLGALSGLLSGTAATVPSWISRLHAQRAPEAYLQNLVRESGGSGRDMTRAYMSYLLPAVVMPGVLGAASSLLHRNNQGDST